jgi:DNA-binding NarL/FixJ family response regulator
VLNLTPRDRDICDLLLQAFSNREIAEPLGMTKAAVKMALERIFLRNDIDPRRDRRVLLALLYYGEKIRSPGVKTCMTAEATIERLKEAAA